VGVWGGRSGRRGWDWIRGGEGSAAEIVVAQPCVLTVCVCEGGQRKECLVCVGKGGGGGRKLSFASRVAAGNGAGKRWEGDTERMRIAGGGAK
jgi:hypothetical protein